VIRTARDEDVPALRRLMRESNGYPEPAARAMIVGYARSWSLPDTPGAVVRVLEDGDGIAGFHKLVPHPDGMELDLFFTDNARQGRGYGRSLFADACERARAAGAARLVIVSNPAAAEFYRRMGARDDGVAAPGTAGISWPRPRLVVEL
jgi:GNAT superfamily N-acetyltransferase